jgi:hypothetical protein
MANSAELFDPMHAALRDELPRRDGPEPMPMRVSSVWAHAPMFGSSFLFHGMGFRHMGCPSTAAWPPPGPKMITSYFPRRFGVFLTVSGSM